MSSMRLYYAVGKRLLRSNVKTTAVCSFATRVRRRRPDITLYHKSEDKPDNTALQNDENASKWSSEERMKLIDESNSTGLFVAKDKDGREISMDEYLKFASLSPWVPCPEPVVRKMLDITKVGSDDIHYELGSGDGRVNFHAIDMPYMVKKSVGVDIDPNMIQQANDRILKRHPKPNNIEFKCIDLVSDDIESQQLWEKIREECTVLTMFFVEDALQKLRPKLEKYLYGSGCKIVMVGYEMKQWEPRWSERILDLPVHMYVMDDYFEERDESKVEMEMKRMAEYEMMPPIKMTDVAQEEFDSDGKHEYDFDEDDDWDLDETESSDVSDNPKK